MEQLHYGGWDHCVRLTNGDVEIFVTTDVGPRIIRAGFCGGANFFHEAADFAGLTGGDEWRNYGGHRLWHAPEVSPRTYAPDNSAVAWQEKDGALILQQDTEPDTGIRKTLIIRLQDEKNQVQVLHQMTNTNPWDITFAPWALSVMAPGGFAVLPQEEFRPHPDYLLPARPLVLWHYTDMSDPRWTWGNDYILLRQDSEARTKQKIGAQNKQGWMAYCLGEAVFIKTNPFVPGASYVDYGCNAELYTDSDMLEIETLGPQSVVAAGATVQHEETWLFAREEVEDTESDVQAKLPGLAEQILRKG